MKTEMAENRNTTNNLKTERDTPQLTQIPTILQLLPPHSVIFPLIFLPWFLHIILPLLACHLYIHYNSIFPFFKLHLSFHNQPTLALGPFSFPTLPSVFFLPFLQYTCKMGLTIALPQYMIITISTDHNKILTRS